jgi:hypothetical protein
MKRSRGPLPEPVRVSGAGIHLPNPSYWPAVAALGVAAVFVGVMLLGHIGPLGIVAGVALLLFGIYRWAFEPAG